LAELLGTTEAGVMETSVAWTAAGMTRAKVARRARRCFMRDEGWMIREKEKAGTS
jgi:hypothetical protein